MKEKHNSEKKLHDDFGSFQMPFEQEAFNKFLAALDKEKKNRKVIWWKKLGLVLIPIFIIGSVASYAFFQKIVIKEGSASIQSKNEVSIPISETSILNAEDTVETKPHLASEITNTKSKKTTPESGCAPDLVASDAIEAVSNIKKPKVPAKTSIDLLKHSDSTKDITTNLSGGSLSKKTWSHEKSAESLLIELTNTNQEKSDNVEPDIISSFELLIPLSTLKRSPFLLKSDDSLERFDFNLKPFSKPYKKYFYFRLLGGVAINDNFGPYDRHFQILDSKEYIYGAALAYKFSPNHAVEFSFSQHDFAVGYRHRQSAYTSKNGTKATVIKAGLISRLWTIKEGIELSMTNGIAFMNGDNGSFGKRSFGSNTPLFVEESTIERVSLSSSRRVLYSTGLRMDVSLSRSLDLSFDSNYKVGFKPWIDSQLRYIEGEGVINFVDSYSEGNFFSFTVGLKYNLKGG
ncbi:MAG: hypothetical protein AAGA77_06345 [Bacteroidota bacterium]